MTYELFHGAPEVARQGANVVRSAHARAVWGTGETLDAAKSDAIQQIKTNGRTGYLIGDDWFVRIGSVEIKG